MKQTGKQSYSDNDRGNQTYARLYAKPASQQQCDLKHITSQVCTSISSSVKIGVIIPHRVTCRIKKHIK